ncbi:MAG TPA: hypothetical protein VNN76_00025 [Bacteroidota bacterium]|nr:hypothetical protein [Bacteroidota bacterium]
MKTTQNVICLLLAISIPCSGCYSKKVLTSVEDGTSEKIFIETPGKQVIVLDSVEVDGAGRILGSGRYLNNGEAVSGPIPRDSIAIIYVYRVDHDKIGALLAVFVGLPLIAGIILVAAAYPFVVNPLFQDFSTR